LDKALQLHTIALHFRHVNIHTENLLNVGAFKKRARVWVRVGSGGGKIGELKIFHPKDTASLYGTSFNPARKDNPFVSR
jgi:hypothetical protein